MTQLKTSRLCLVSAAALFVTALSACVSQGPDVAHPNAPPPGLRFFSPFGMSQPNRTPDSSPPGATFCLLSTARLCSEVFPEPAHTCLLGTERCPRDGKFERIEQQPLVQPR